MAKKKYVVSIELCMTGDPMCALKGNNSCKSYYFRVKVRHVQISITS